MINSQISLVFVQIPLKILSSPLLLSKKYHIYTINHFLDKTALIKYDLYMNAAISTNKEKTTLTNTQTIVSSTSSFHTTMTDETKINTV